MQEINLHEMFFIATVSIQDRIGRNNALNPFREVKSTAFPVL